MFKVEKHELGRFDCHRLINQSTGEYLEILTDLGAGINDWVIKDGGGRMTSVIDGYRSEDDLLSTHHTAFKGSKLSPFPNRIPKGKYSFGDAAYQFNINEADQNSLHGFMHDRSFDVLSIQETATEAVLKLSHSYKGETQGYPFQFLMEVDVLFGLEGIHFKTRVTNTGKKNMPLADGWHPYYCFEDLNYVQLELGTVKVLTDNMRGNSELENPFETLSVIGDISMDDCFEIIACQDQHRISIRDHARQININIWQQCSKNQYPYFQVYTTPSRKSIAIEPVSSPINAFNTKVGLISLDPNASYVASFRVAIDQI